MATRTKRRKDSTKEPKEEDEAIKVIVNRRGRPRVESQDQSAVERRRTQIRLAQRAYRERKETTISVLEAQVNHLKHVIHEMTKTVSEFNDQASASSVANLQPSLAQDINIMLEKVNELHRHSGIGDEEGSGTFSSLSTNSRQSSISQPKPTTPPTHLIHTSQYADTPMVDSRYGIEGASLGMLGYRMEYGSSPSEIVVHDAATEQLNNWNETWATTQATPVYSQNSDKHSPMSPGTWELNIPRGMKLAHTFSWQETSFARRLLRHSHERCLDILTNPNAKIDPTNNRARYSLSFMSKDDLIAKVKRTTCKTISEPLEDWSMPMLHVGGAGLHFDRDASEAIPPAGFTAERNTGPFPLPSAAITVPPIYFPDKVAKWLGIDGTWFDNRDVEVYLKIKGINVDGGSSTTVVEIEDTPGYGSPSSAGSPTEGIESTGASIPGIGRIVTPQDQLVFSEFDKLINSGVSPRRRKIEVSLDKLVYELNERCFCLGRAPGYKQTDVDEVYQRVIAEAYIQSSDENMLLGSVIV